MNLHKFTFQLYSYAFASDGEISVMATDAAQAHNLATRAICDAIEIANKQTPDVDIKILNWSKTS